MSERAADQILAFRQECDAIEAEYQESIRDSKGQPASLQDLIAMRKLLGDLRDCQERHFPKLNLGDPRTVDTPAKLWAYITHGVLRPEEVANGIARPGPEARRQRINEHLKTVWTKMLKLDLDGVPDPYFDPNLSEQEAVNELVKIANRLARPARPQSESPAPRVEFASGSELAELVTLARNIQAEIATRTDGEDTIAKAATTAHHYVDLDQIAATVNRSKSTMEKLKRRRPNPLPDPDIPGGGGKPDEWVWERIKPWLEDEFKKPNLPMPHRLT